MFRKFGFMQTSNGNGTTFQPLTFILTISFVQLNSDGRSNFTP